MPGPKSPLSHIEKVVLRNGYIYAKTQNKRYLTRQKTSDLKRVGTIISTNRVEKLAAALHFTRNSGIRAFKSLQITACVDEYNISKKLLSELKCYVNKALNANKKTSRANPVSSLLPDGQANSTASSYLLLKRSECIAVTETVNIAIETAREGIGSVSNNEVVREGLLEEFDNQVYWDHLPQDVSIMLYENGCVQGIENHRDYMAMFATVIVVIHESEVGNLEVKEIGLEGPLQEGYMVVINNGTEHEIEMVARRRKRVVLIITL